MFTGIIESIGAIKEINTNGSNKTFKIVSPITHELKPDQSLAHNGCCLTVEKIENGFYEVTAIDETLRKTNLGELKIGDKINLERCMKIGDRLDGHIVQGHVDRTGKCTQKKSMDGSTVFSFEFSSEFSSLIVEKGSICVNGVSLTAFDCTNNSFSVAIIPYTMEHTNFHSLNTGDIVNLEFDILGKYVQKRMDVFSRGV